MDTIKVLLGVTVALLLGALAMSWKDFQREVEQTPKEELAELQRQIREIQREQELLRLERERILPSKTQPSTSPQPVPPAVPEVPPVVSQAPAADVPMPEFPDSEEPDVAQPLTPSVAEIEKRAAAIKSAPAVAKISEWIEDPQIGSFATLEIVDAGSVKKGAILSLRRHSGILGKLKVTDVTPDGAVAGATTPFGELKPEAGDELILEPGD